MKNCLFFFGFMVLTNLGFSQQKIIFSTHVGYKSDFSGAGASFGYNLNKYITPNIGFAGSMTDFLSLSTGIRFSFNNTKSTFCFLGSNYRISTGNTFGIEQNGKSSVYKISGNSYFHPSLGIAFYDKEGTSFLSISLSYRVPLSPISVKVIDGFEDPDVTKRLRNKINEGIGFTLSWNAGGGKD